MIKGFFTTVFVLILVISSSFANLDESSMNECLSRDFEISVSHRTFPLGLLERKLFLKKEKCLLNITHESFFVWNQGWKVDVCREPVHIKKGFRSTEVIKKHRNCSSAFGDLNPDIKEEQESFCSNLSKLSKLIEDDGLIFASGEKEDLNSDHGKTYCGYILLKRYLERNEVLSRFEKISAYYKNPANMPQSKDAFEERVQDEEVVEEVNSGLDSEMAEIPPMEEMPEEIETKPESDKNLPVEVTNPESESLIRSEPTAKEKILNFFKGLF